MKKSTFRKTYNLRSNKYCRDCTDWYVAGEYSGSTCGDWYACGIQTVEVCDPDGDDLPPLGDGSGGGYIIPESDPQTKPLPSLYIDATTSVFSKDPNGTPIKISEYTKCFDDGKNAKSYKITVFIEQPVINEKRMWALSPTEDGFIDAGHTFIMFEKDNSDGTIIRQVVGLYPKDKVSPNHPIVDGNIVDNSDHNYNISMELIVNQNQFDLALEKANSFSGKKYDLNNFNCTDFSIEIAKYSGQEIPDPQGYWTENSGGSNPGYFGQDVGKMTNTLTMKISKFDDYNKAPKGKGPCK